jgi:hypothetical protein
MARHIARWLSLLTIVLVPLSCGLLVVRHTAARSLDTPTPEIIIVTATPYRCDNGDVLGSSTACPMAILNVGPTPTADPYHTIATAGDGREFSVYRGWSYGESLIVGLLLLLCGLAVFDLVWRVKQGA